MATITRTSEALAVTGVEDVHISEIVTANNESVRLIRVYDSVAPNRLPVLEVKLVGDSPSKVKVTTPELEF